MKLSLKSSFILYLILLQAACYVKPHDVYREYPTINIFHTGTFQLIGGHSFEQINEAAKIARRLTVACRKQECKEVNSSL